MSECMSECIRMIVLARMHLRLHTRVYCKVQGECICEVILACTAKSRVSVLARIQWRVSRIHSRVHTSVPLHTCECVGASV